MKIKSKKYFCIFVAIIFLFSIFSYMGCFNVTTKEFCLDCGLIRVSNNILLFNLDKKLEKTSFSKLLLINEARVEKCKWVLYERDWFVFRTKYFTRKNYLGQAKIIADFADLFIKEFSVSDNFVNSFAGSLVTLWNHATHSSTSDIFTNDLFEIYKYQSINYLDLEYSASKCFDSPIYLEEGMILKQQFYHINGGLLEESEGYFDEHGTFIPLGKCVVYDSSGDIVYEKTIGSKPNRVGKK